MRRWLIRILIGVAIAIVAVIVIVQIVLWTPLPRRIVTQLIEKELGLRISAANLSTGWLGNSELTDVSLGLPLSNNDFLKVKRLKIKHSSLIGLALGNMNVGSIEIDDPQVYVVQDANGAWNLQQVLVLLGRLGGSNTAQNQTTGSNAGGAGPVPKLPSVRLVNGLIHVADNQHHSVDLKPLNVTGASNGLLVWDYKLTIADSISMTGKLAPGGNWQHQITLAAHDLDPLLKDWGVPTTYSANLKSQWDGQLTDGKLTGTLIVQKATASKVPALGDIQFTGSVNALVDGSVVTLHPNNLILTTALLALPTAGIESGTIIYDSSGVRAQALTLRALGGLSNVDASFDPQTLATDLHARWSGLSLAKQTSQYGSLNAKLRLPFAGQPVITMDLEDSGTIGVPTNRWNAKLNLTGQGRSWQNIDWILTAPQLVYSTKSERVDLSQLSAHVSQHLPIVELTSMSLPSSGNTLASFNSSGRVDFGSKHWNFDAAGGFNTTFENTPVPMNIVLHTSGTNNRYDLKSLVLGFADLTFTADGSYDTSLPTPVNLHILLAQTPRIVSDSPVQGEVNGDFNIVGALFEEHGRFRPYLTTTGDLRSNDLVLFNRPIGDIDIKLAGITRTPNLPGEEPGPTITEIHTVDFKLFEAPWDLSINCPDAQGNLQAVLETRRLPLEELARFAKQKGITGQLNAKWNLVIPSDSLHDLDLQSEYHLTDVNLKGLTADTVDATATLKDGLLKLNPLIAKSGAGVITTTASIDLQNPSHLNTETTVDRWPYRLSGAVGAVVSAHTKLDLDLKAKDLGANGSLTASTDLLLGEKTKLAHADLAATILNRMVSIDQLTGKVVSGTFNGAAKFDFDKPLQAAGQITCENIDGAAIATMFPAADGLTGKYSLAITLAPARDPRPLEPVRMDINVASTNARFRSMQIGDGSLLTLHGVSYLNIDRAVLDHSDLYMAGGVAHIWGRISYRHNARLATQVAVDFEHFQLDQLAHIDPLLKKPIPGILNGHIGVIRSGPHSSQVLAQAHVDLTQTDLGNFGPLAALYSVMHLGSSSKGYGTVDLGFQQDVLRVTDFHFFNSGLEARGLCSVGPIDYTTPLNSKIGGQLVGTLQPLKDIKLPFISDFNQAFNAFQGSLTAIDLVGTLGEPHYPSALATDLGKTLQQLLVGEAEGNTQ
jgi:hypothetical protein